MKKLAILSVLFVGILSACASQQAQTTQVPELPVSRVVMYQSGIGYIERTANIEGDEFVLRIRPDQINDILKSLTVIDRGNGRPVSISLPVDKTTLDRLAQIPEQIHEGGLTEMLRAFRGANVKIRAKNGAFEGRIIGIEEPAYGDNDQININTNQPTSGRLTLFANESIVNVIQLDDIRSVELYDKAISDGVTKSLNISLNEGSWKQIELRIRMDSSKKRELALSYLIAMPTWKPAYRLILDNQEQGTLQGWAIISNVTGSDWNNISFSLVSGQPMSFTYDLYTPQFLDRPDLTGQARTKALAPQVTASAVSTRPTAAPPRPSEPSYARAGGAAFAQKSALAAKKSHATSESINMMAMDYAMDEEVAMADVAEAEAEPMYDVIDDSEILSNFQDLASTSQLGSFDEYKLKSGLTVADGNTALVNLVQNTLSARDTRLFKEVPYYNFDEIPRSWHDEKSFQTVELKNSSEVALDEGPITIYRDSAIIGEGYLSRTAKDSTAYITFAAEERLSVSLSDNNAKSDWQLDSVANGRCKYTEIKTQQNHFKFDSHLDASTTAILPLKRFSGWEPVNFPENVVKNDTAYMVSVPVPAGESVDLPLTMQKKISRSEQLQSDACVRAVDAAIAQNLLPQDLASDLKKFTESQKRLSDINMRYNQLNSQSWDIKRDQKSISDTLLGLKNIKSKTADSLRNQLIERQKSNDKKLEEIMTQTYELTVEKSELEMTIKTLNRTLQYTRS